MYASVSLFDLDSVFDLLFTVKAFIHRHADELHQHPDPVCALMEVISCITAEKAYGWFKNAGYIVV